MSLNRNSKQQAKPNRAATDDRHAFVASNNRGFHARQWRENVPCLRQKLGNIRAWVDTRTYLPVIVFILLIAPTHAVMHSFDNCLPDSIVNSRPLMLQFVPLNVSVTFESHSTAYALNVTVFGNVSGTADQQSYYPPPDDPQWLDPNSTLGKIEDLSRSNNRYSTLLTKVNVLTFSPYSDASRFCSSVIQGDCPLAPVFHMQSSKTDLSELRAFSAQHDMLFPYRFSTMSSELKILSGSAGANQLGCIIVEVTPDLGSSLKDMLRYVPLVILLLVGLATISAAIYSPWGSTNPLHWTSNYGRDEDTIRLVTPGFGDCLQYIQFVVLAGSLSLDYPGYYQPVVSQASWSSLMFNQSFTTHGTRRNPVVDGIYAVNGAYGLDRIGHLVGMQSASDIWPGMIVWLLIAVLSVIILIQMAFGLRRIYRGVSHIPKEDLRAKSMPFTLGNVIRVVFNYLFLPVVSISFFQLVIASQSPPYSVALAVILIVIVVAFFFWTARVIVTARPKSYLFDDLPTVLLYGPLYNTYCDDATAYALVPILLSFARGIAFGALQPSGIAQIVLLAVCEVVSVLTLVAFRPFPRPTSMNLYQSCFSAVRFLTIILSVTFVPSLGVSVAARGWIGYTILFLHALVLVFGFFLNALQTLVEVVARLAGAGGHEGGATRGGLAKVLGRRQLSRRAPRHSVGRQSVGSEVPILAQAGGRISSQFDGYRPRSFSATSGLLLGGTGANDRKGFILPIDTGNNYSGAHSRMNSDGCTPTTTDSYGFTSYQVISSNSRNDVATYMQPQDPYYRPPRPRAKTISDAAASSREEISFVGTDEPTNYDDEDDIADGSLIPRGGTPTPAYMAAPKDDLDYDDTKRARKDYAVREVDFYYGVRGPPLSQSGNRKLKTGPADPTSPVSSATGWFRGIFTGKTKDKAKGFEVVRSARAAPPDLSTEGEDYDRPYLDEPGVTAHAGNSRRNTTIDHTVSRDPEGSNSRHRSELILSQIDSSEVIELPTLVKSHDPEEPPSSAPKRSSKEQVSHDSVDRASSPLLVAADESLQNANWDHETVTLHSLRRHTPGTGWLPFSARGTTYANHQLSASPSTTSSTTSQRAVETVSGAAQIERPSSVGYVAQHRTRDNIHETSLSGPSFTGSTADLVDELTQGEDKPKP